MFHLAAIVSGQAEADTDLGYRVNLDGTRAVLDACRALGTSAKVDLRQFAGGLWRRACRRRSARTTALMPQSSYGAQKAIGELLVNDYSRKGFIDGMALRLPTVVVRPGLPNRAASTFASSMIREPLTGRDAVCPVSPDTVMALASPRRIVAGLAHALDLPSGALGASRSLQLPGFSVSVGEMAEALRRAGGEEAYRRIRWAARPADPGDHFELAASAGRTARRGARFRARQRHRRGHRGFYRGRSALAAAIGWLELIGSDRSDPGKETPICAAQPLFSACSPCLLAAAGSPRAETRPVVVELFTSQGCSSCPPADALLRELAGRADVIALGFHISYWDRLGWKDPLSNEASTDRQKAYASRLSGRVYTPQIVVEGTNEMVGSDRAAVAAALRNARPEAVAPVSFAADRASVAIGGGAV